jgi:hypothetical protein
MRMPESNESVAAIWRRKIAAAALSSFLCIGLVAFFAAPTCAQDSITPEKQSESKQDQKTDDQEKTKRPKLFDEPMDFSKPPTIGKIDGPSAAEIRLGIEKGVQFMLKTQNKDGSWGSHVTRRDFEIYAPIPGAHHAFRMATTALGVSALLETQPDNSEVRRAVKEAQEYLFKNLPRLKRATADAIYNIWGHAYAIQALVRLKNWKATDEATRKKIDEYIREQMEMLKRYESVDGGWGYYDFRVGSRKPAADSTSFVNATVLVAFYEAQQVGIEPDKKIVKRAVDATIRQQKPDFTYLYGEYLRKMPMMGINRPGGSLGRTQACNVALRLWGDKKITDNVIKNWLYRLYLRNGWLSMGRKRPIPHESWMAVAGYFYYYGHYYAGLNLDVLKPEERGPYQQMLAKIMLKHQEPNGCWWDYTLYSYHQQYGTAFALMTLQRCLPRKDDDLTKQSSDSGKSKK